MEEKAKSVAGTLSGQPRECQYRYVDLPLGGQVYNVWCWASTAEMITTSFGDEVTVLESKTGVGKVTQFQQATDRANLEFRLPDQEPIDCSDPKTIAEDLKRPPGERVCVRGGWPLFEHYGFEHRTTKRFRPALTWKQLTAEIDADRPIAFSWRYNDNNEGHMMVAAGYVSIPPDGQLVIVHDPWPPGSGDRYLIPYSYYKSGPYKHWRDYYHIQPSSAADPGFMTSLLASFKAKIPAVDSLPDPFRTFRNWQRSQQAAAKATSPVARSAEPIKLPEPEIPQLDDEQQAAAAKVANAALQQFAMVVEDKSLAERLDIRPAEEGAELQLDEPFPIYEFSVKDLKEWLEAGATPTRWDLMTRAAALLKRKAQPVGRMVFPVIALPSGKIVATITVRRFSSEWRIETMARSSLLNHLPEFNKKTESGVDPMPRFAVDLPALYQFFIAYEDGLEPIYFDRGLGLQAVKDNNRKLSLVEVFNAVRPLVENFRGALG